MTCDLCKAIEEICKAMTDEEDHPICEELIKTLDEDINNSKDEESENKAFDKFYSELEKRLKINEEQIYQILEKMEDDKNF